MLRQYFLRPSTNIDLINERLQAVTVLTRPDNEVVVASICKRLGNIKDARKMTAKLRKGAAGGTNRGVGIARSIWLVLQKVHIPETDVSSKLQLIRKKVHVSCNWDLSLHW